MIRYSTCKITILLTLSFFLSAAYADNKETPGPATHYQNETSRLINQAVNEIINSTRDKAKAFVQDSTGVDFSEHGFGKQREHAPLPDCASDEAHRRLSSLKTEYNNEIHKLHDEFNGKLTSDESEFAREAAREDRPERVHSKRDMLKKKVDEDYAKFNDKVAEQNREFNARRDRIISMARGSDQCKNLRDNGERESEGRGNDRGEQEREAQDHAGKRADKGKASDQGGKRSEAQGETKKHWWQFWKK